MNLIPHNQDLVVLDFETTGLSPSKGDRVVEVGAVKLRGDRVLESFQSLINPGFALSSFVQDLTGIDNRMLGKAPRALEVMRRFASFIEGCPLVAHNASFDGKFLDAEFERAGLVRRHPFCCSLLVARRLYPEAPNHRLETLVRYKGLEVGDSFHRALDDSQMTARLWIRMLEEIRRDYGLAQVDFDLMQRLGRTPRRQIVHFLRQRAEEQESAPLLSGSGGE